MITAADFYKWINIFKIAPNGAGNPLSYQGAWNASTNTPTLVSSTGTANQFYIVSVPGTTTLDGVSSWAVGDWVIFNGTVWQKIPAEVQVPQLTANLVLTQDLSATTIYNNGTSGVGATITNSGTQVALTIDGEPADVDDLVLVQGFVTNFYANGLYMVTNAGSGSTNWSMVRTASFNTAAQMTLGRSVVVVQGDVYQGTVFSLVSQPETIGTDAITFSSPVYAVNQLNLSSLESEATSRANLGLTPASTFAYLNASSSQVLAANMGYKATSGSLITLTLPTTCAENAIIEIVGFGAGGWKIAQNAGQSINFDRLTTTTGTGGYIASTLQNDSVKLLCTVANTSFQVISAVGNITVV